MRKKQRDIPEAQKNLLKKEKKKKFAEILNVPFFLKNETFSPRASISNPLQPPLLFVSKTWQLLLPVKGVKSASLRSSPTIARQEISDEKDAIRLNDRLTSVVPNNVHPYICVALSANFAIARPAFGRWYMSNDLVKSVEQQTPRVKGGRLMQILFTGREITRKPSSGQMAPYNSIARWILNSTNYLSW